MGPIASLEILEEPEGEPPKPTFAETTVVCQIGCLARITKFCNLLSKFLYRPDDDPVRVETVA
jgi:hypothetical protein